MRLDFWDKVDSPAFILVYNLGIYLGGFDIGVAKKFGDGVEVCSVGQCEGCEGVACNMKCDVLCNAISLSAFYIIYKIAVCHNLSVFPIERLQRYGKNRKSLKNPSF